jgi:hypothetical protein
MNWVLRRLAKTRLLRYLLPRHPWLRERLTRAPDSRAVGVTKLVLKEMEMTCRNDLGRRSFLKSAAVLGGASTVGALPSLAGAQDTPQQTDTPVTTLQNVAFSSEAKHWHLLIWRSITLRKRHCQNSAQFGALFHTQDFLEGRRAEAEGRKLVYHGR